MSNTAIFIDYDNIYVNLEQYYETSNNSDLKVHIISKIKERFKDDRVIMFKAFADFQKVNSIITKLQKSQIELRHVYSNNQGRKNASDIALTIDIIKSLYSCDSIEKYVIVSSDSDMLPIINEIQHFGKDIVVMFSDYGSIGNYEDYVSGSNCISVEKLLEMSNVYEPIKIENIKLLANEYLTLINTTIWNIYNSHKDRSNKPNGTASIKDIRKKIWESKKIVYNDVDRIIQYFLDNGYIFEYYVDDNASEKIHYKIAMNESKIKLDGIDISNVVDYSRVFYSNYKLKK